MAFMLNGPLGIHFIEWRPVQVLKSSVSEKRPGLQAISSLPCDAPSIFAVSSNHFQLSGKHPRLNVRRLGSTSVPVTLCMCPLPWACHSEPLSQGFLICELYKWPSEGWWEVGKRCTASLGKYIRISRVVVFNPPCTWESPEFGLGWAKLWNVLEDPPVILRSRGWEPLLKGNKCHLRSIFNIDTRI